MGQKLNATVTTFLVTGFGLTVFLVISWITGDGESIHVLKLSKPKASDIGATLLSFVLVALFVERAVEVYAIVRREPKRKDLYTKSVLASKSEKVNADKELEKHQNDTQFQASILSVGIGLAIALGGVQALSVFLEDASLSALKSCTTGTGGSENCTYTTQYILFMTVDVLVTAALLGGGADGIHKIITPFMTYSKAVTAQNDKVLQDVLKAKKKTTDDVDSDSG